MPTSPQPSTSPPSPSLPQSPPSSPPQSPPQSPILTPLIMPPSPPTSYFDRIYSSYPPWATIPLIIILSIPPTIITSLTTSPSPSQNETIQAISTYIGYIYFFSWSLSFYPQIIFNYQRKGTQGLSPDFAVLNVLGFCCYCCYTLALKYSSVVRSEYCDVVCASENDDSGSGESESECGPQVTFQDVLFAVHAVVMSSVTLSQVCWFDGLGMKGRERSSDNLEYESVNDDNEIAISPRPKQRINNSTFYIVLFSVSTSIIYILLILLSPTNESSLLSYLSFMYYLSGQKMVITLLKYTPQILLNIHNKSTTGWNIYNVLLDLSGGLFSVLQLVIDCASKGDWGGILGDWVKFGLGIVSMVFDGLFILQHYVIYPS